LETTSLRVSTLKIILNDRSIVNLADVSFQSLLPRTEYQLRYKLRLLAKFKKLLCSDFSLDISKPIASLLLPSRFKNVVATAKKQTFVAPSALIVLGQTLKDLLETSKDEAIESGDNKKNNDVRHGGVI